MITIKAPGASHLLERPRLLRNTTFFVPAPGRFAERSGGWDSHRDPFSLYSFYPAIMKLWWTIICLQATFLAGLHAQQIPTVLQATQQAALYNPAAHGATAHHHLTVQGQQGLRRLAGMESHTRLVAYSSPALGPHLNKGWGLLVQSHRAGVLFRHDVRLGMGIQLINKGWRSRKGDVIDTKIVRLAIGGYAGLASGGANFSALLRRDDFDPLLDRIPTQWELDAGIGIDFRYTCRAFRSSISVHTAQLPSGSRPDLFGSSIHRVPHLLLQGSLRYLVDPTVEVGPEIMWVRALADPLTPKASRLDVLLRTHFKCHNFWVLSGFRTHQAAFVVGGGLAILQQPEIRRNHSLQLNCFFAIPKGANTLPGTLTEIGLHWRFGNGRAKLRPNTLVRK